ncbi:hypothetical protein C8A00DRAFT_42471 [Chaetomidium leptoderma]|uniref:Uncharacterized protein n=1 Tax=Chaetomidium leptoderma TaxID=669021 RepID=A0AAN6VND1_9PEZI|nr:hypothetical protein C8A00DRAFT_42471 [Chaetomidium leptoderma]
MQKGLLPTALAALLWTQFACAATLPAHDVTKDFLGRGQIHLLNSSNFNTACPDDRIGCLNGHGMLTLNDCAVFNRNDAIPSFPTNLGTAAGNCSFRDQDMPRNTDSYYGADSFAWSCGGKNIDGLDEYYYTVTGFNYPFICSGDIRCYYDIVGKAPTHHSPPMPVWQFFWGGSQMDIEAGHWRVILLWVPLAKESPGGAVA